MITVTGADTRECALCGKEQPGFVTESEAFGEAFIGAKCLERAVKLVRQRLPEFGRRERLIDNGA